MQRMNPPRGMGPMGPGPQVTSSLLICPSVSPAICVNPLSLLSPQSVSHISGSQLRGRAHSGDCEMLGGNNSLWVDSGQT